MAVSPPCQVKWWIFRYNFLMEIAFGKILRELREEKEMTQAQLGKLLNVAGTTIRGWESSRHEPNLSNLYRLSKIFDVTVGQLLGVEEY